MAESFNIWSYQGMSASSSFAGFPYPHHGCQLCLGELATARVSSLAYWTLESLPTPSFNKKYMLLLSAKFKGACDGRAGFHCNNNVIGNMSFLDENSNHEHEIGHNTHAVSMDAGKFHVTF
jgi:hypothetical protein